MRSVKLATDITVARAHFIFPRSDAGKKDETVLDSIASFTAYNCAQATAAGFPMHRPHASLLARLRSAASPGAKLILLSAMAAAAGAAESVHGWGLVDWGMTEGQVQSAYGDSVAKLPGTRIRRAEIVETLHLKNPMMIGGIALTQSFAFSRASKGLERVVMRTSLSNASSEQCQAAYGKIRQSEISQFAEPVEEKPALRSLHARWHGTAADARLSLIDVTGRCFLTLVYTRPNLMTAPLEETTNQPADQRPTTTQ